MGHLPEREVCYMRRHIDFDKIGITDDVMFCTVLSNSEDCREFLQRILGIEIEEIVVVGTQVSMKSNFHAKGVRLDVYAKDKKGNAYDIEMQTTKMRELPLRSRYYHSEMDSYQIAEGEKYGNLKHSIVIFVCNFDLFAKNRSVYTFESICREDTEIHLQDKRKTIFININGSREDVPEELAHLLDCIGNKNKPPAMQVCSQTALASSKKPPCYNEYKVRQPNHYNKEESKWTIIVYHTQNGHANII